MSTGKEITAEERAALEAQHGELFVAETAFGDFVFRSPRLADMQRFAPKADLHDEKMEANRVLALNCVVWPDPDPKAALAAVFEKKPGLIFGLGGEVAVLGGLTSKAFRKK